MPRLCLAWVNRGLAVGIFFLIALGSLEKDQASLSVTHTLSDDTGSASMVSDHHGSYA